MKTNNRSTVEKSTFTNTLLIVILFLIALNFPFSAGECTNTWSDDAEYIAMTNELIKVSLKDFQNQVVWLDGIELQAAPLICSFYEKNNYKSVWTKGNEMTAQSIAALNLLKDSYKYGFEPSNFDILSLEHFIHSLSKEDQAEKSAMIRVRFEFLMTNSVFAFMSYLSQGAEYSSFRDAFVNGNPVVSNFPDYLYEIKSSVNIQREILKLQPKDNDYALLQSEMETIIMNMETSKSSISIPDPEEDPVRVHNLFSYIFSSEGLTNEALNLTETEVFTTILIEFQNIAGIKNSGKIDNTTRRVATNLIQSKYDEIAYRLECIRKRTRYDESLISFNY